MQTLHRTSPILASAIALPPLHPSTSSIFYVTRIFDIGIKPIFAMVLVGVQCARTATANEPLGNRFRRKKKE